MRGVPTGSGETRAGGFFSGVPEGGRLERRSNRHSSEGRWLRSS